MTEGEARMIGKAICEEAKVVGLPVQDPMERRAICLKFAIETKGVTFSIDSDGTASEAARQVLEAASLYYAFVSGEDPYHY